MKNALIRGDDLEVALNKGNKLKENSWKLTKGEGSIWGCGKGKGREGMCEEKISSYVWNCVVHGKDVYKK